MTRRNSVVLVETEPRGTQLSIATYTYWRPGKNREAMDRLPGSGLDEFWLKTHRA